jgi:hypothetical protein
MLCVVAIVTVAGTVAHVRGNVAEVQSGIDAGSSSLDPQKMIEAQRSFFNARYDDAAALTLELRASSPEDLAVCELRTSALLFQIKAALGDRPDKDKAFKQCAECAGVMATFLSEIARGQVLARARLRAAPDDDEARFFLGKIDLNYVWLQLGTLGRKTGWDEYWEARKSLDAVLARNPAHVRARVARAWIDYIVDTRMPRGTRWMLGGGNRKKALLDVQKAVEADASYFEHVEAMFALWDLQVRERNVAAASTTARVIARDFPDNRELTKFLERHHPAPPPPR